MARIQGITIELGADSSKLNNALSSAQNALSKTQKSLNQVNNALKFNPGNTTLLAQKQELLTRKVDETKNKLTGLKQALSTMEANGVDKTSDQFMAVEREIIKTESQLKSYEKELRQVINQNSALGQMGAKFEQLGGKLTSAGQSMRAMSMAAAAVATAIGAAAVKASEWADNLRTTSKITGIGTADLQKYSAAAELVDVSAETIGKSMTKMKKNMLSASQGSGASAQAFASLGINVRSADGSLRDQNAVFQETIKKLGQMENETERDALAMQIFGKSATELNPLIEDMGETYAKAMDFMASHNIPIVDDATLEQANRFKDAIDTIKMVFQQAVQVIGAKLAGVLAPMMEKVADKLASIAGFIANLNPKILAVVGAIASALAVVAPALLIAGKMSTVIGKMLPQINGLITGTGAFGKAISGVFGLLKANPIIAIVGGVLAFAVALSKAGVDIDKFVSNFTQKIASIAERVATLAPLIITKLVSGLISNVGKLATGAISIITTLIQSITSNLPMLITSAITIITALATGLIQNIPMIINAAIQLITGLATGLIQNLPMIIDATIQLITQLAQSLIDNLPLIIDAALQIIIGLAQGLIQNIPQILQAAIQLIIGLGEGLIRAIPLLVRNLPKIISAIAEGLVAGIGEIGKVGVDIIKGLWKGAKDMVGWVVEKFKNLGKKILGGIKKALGIKSPSREFAKVGMFSMLGLANGIDDNISKVNQAMKNVEGAMLTPDLTAQVNAKTTSNIGDSVANAMLQTSALGNQSIARPIQIVVELGGVKVAEQIYRLNKQGQLALG